MLLGSCSSVVRAPTAKVEGLGFDFQRLPRHFFSQYVVLITTSIYHQLSFQQIQNNHEYVRKGSCDDVIRVIMLYHTRRRCLYACYSVIARVIIIVSSCGPFTRV